MKIKDLYPGDRILDSESGYMFIVAGKSPYGDGTLLITDKIISVGAMDAPEPNSDIDNYTITGNGDYSLSNLHQWLNSDETNWYKPTHDADTPPSEEILSVRPNLYDPIGHNPYDKKAGFLCRFTSAFKKHICESSIPCANLDNSGVHMINAKVFVPSAAELGLRTGVINEGTELPLFRNFCMRYASPSEECRMESQWQPAYFRENHCFWYWLRTPNTVTPGFFAYVHTTNPFAYKFACSPWIGIRPMLSISDEADISASESCFGYYRFSIKKEVNE